MSMSQKLLVCIHTLCWGTTYTFTRFKALYPRHQVSRSGITLWVKSFSKWLDESPLMAKRAVDAFNKEHPRDIPLRYIYETRQKLLFKRNSLNYKITKLDIPLVLREVLVTRNALDPYKHCLADEEFLEKMFHASSKINFDRTGCTQLFFTANPTWFLPDVDEEEEEGGSAEDVEEAEGRVSAEGS